MVGSFTIVMSRVKQLNVPSFHFYCSATGTQPSVLTLAQKNRPLAQRASRVSVVVAVVMHFFLFPINTVPLCVTPCSSYRRGGCNDRTGSASDEKRSCGICWKTTSTAATTWTCSGSTARTRLASTQWPRRWIRRTGTHAQAVVLWGCRAPLSTFRHRRLPLLWARYRC